MKYKNALVTGGSSGIGAATVKTLRQNDLTVHALALPEPTLDEVVAQTGAIGHGVDVRNFAALENIVNSLEIDVLINNVGIIGKLMPFQKTDRRTIDDVLDINLRTSLYLTHLVLPQMLERNCGHIFFTGSMAGKHPTANTAVYAATKAALHSFAEGLRLDLLGSAIRVTVLVPGRVETRLYDEIFGTHEKAQQTLYDQFDAIQPDDIAQLIFRALELPANVDVTVLEVNATMQAFGGSITATR